MKTPREILIEQHSHAEPKLDEIRQIALASLSPATPRKANPQPQAQSHFGWRNLLFSLRWHFAGISAVWLMVALLNRAPSTPQLTVSGHSPASPRQILMALRENRRQLLELMDPASEQPLPASPQRRTERQLPIAMA